MFSLLVAMVCFAFAIVFVVLAMVVALDGK
jgi:hypothetical protein